MLFSKVANEGNDDYTGFEVVAADRSRMCRFVRDRRYRPARTTNQCAKKERPQEEIMYTVEVTEVDEPAPSTSDVMAVAVVVDVAISCGSSTTSSERHYEYLKRAVGGSPFFCPRGISSRGMGLGRIRGGAAPEEQDADASAEQETRSDCSFNPGARVTVSLIV